MDNCNRNPLQHSNIATHPDFCERAESVRRVGVRIPSGAFGRARHLRAHQHSVQRRVTPFVGVHPADTLFSDQLTHTSTVSRGPNMVTEASQALHGTCPFTRRDTMLA
jgi:hypothetical protein